jgi:exoribonuclease-2
VPDAAANTELDYEEEAGDVAQEAAPEAANQVSDADAEVAELASEDVVSEPEVK